MCRAVRPPSFRCRFLLPFSGPLSFINICNRQSYIPSSFMIKVFILKGLICFRSKANKYQIWFIDVVLVTSPSIRVRNSMKKQLCDFWTFRTGQRCSNMQGIKAFLLQRLQKINVLQCSKYKIRWSLYCVLSMLHSYIQKINQAFVA